MLMYGYSFAEAVKAVAVVVGLDGGQIAPRRGKSRPKKPTTPPKTKRGVTALAALWAECVVWDEAPDIADYLWVRGVPLPENACKRRGFALSQAHELLA